MYASHKGEKTKISKNSLMDVHHSTETYHTKT